MSLLACICIDLVFLDFLVPSGRSWIVLCWGNLLSAGFADMLLQLDIMMKVFFREKFVYISLKAFFTKMGRCKICRSYQAFLLYLNQECKFLAVQQSIVFDWVFYLVNWGDPKIYGCYCKGGYFFSQLVEPLLSATEIACIKGSLDEAFLSALAYRFRNQYRAGLKKVHFYLKNKVITEMIQFILGK